jgi:hypothetical protein
MNLGLGLESNPAVYISSPVLERYVRDEDEN